MSRVCLTSLKGHSDFENVINLSPTTKLKIPGLIVQTICKRIDTGLLINVPIGLDPIIIPGLDITITPKFLDSLLIFNLMLNYEAGENVMFVMLKNNTLITTPGYEGYNNIVGNIQWSGLSTSRYDRNVDTTPENNFIQYATISETIEEQTYNLALKNSHTSAALFSLNYNARNVAGNGQETNISIITLMEIAQ